jgi:hypothetical protein
MPLLVVGLGKRSVIVVRTGEANTPPRLSPDRPLMIRLERRGRTRRLPTQGSDTAGAEVGVKMASQAVPTPMERDL